MADRELEFDQGMSLVVIVDWGGFAVSAEVGVGADCTLVSITTNVVLAALDSTQGTIAIDAEMCLWTWPICRQWLVQRDKTVTWMNLRGAEVASRAVIPVGAVQALVADTSDSLYQS